MKTEKMARVIASPEQLEEIYVTPQINTNDVVTVILADRSRYSSPELWYQDVETGLSFPARYLKFL